MQNFDQCWTLLHIFPGSSHVIRKILTCELDRSSALNIECFRKALLRIKVHHSVCIVVANIRMWSVECPAESMFVQITQHNSLGVGAFGDIWENVAKTDVRSWDNTGNCKDRIYIYTTIAKSFPQYTMIFIRNIPELPFIVIWLRPMTITGRSQVRGINCEWLRSLVL